MAALFRKHLWAAVALLTIAVGFSNLFFLAAADLHPDEAYYWVWSRDLKTGYFDNSPLIANIIHLSTAVFGKTEFGVRFPAFLGWLFIIFFVYRFTLKIYNKRAIALLAVFIADFTPLVASGGHLMTPDILMTFFASFTWYFLYRAIEEEKSDAWYPAGIFLGLSLLSKFQGGLIALAALTMVLARPEKRKWLLRKEPYLAVLIGLSLFAPVLYWNWKNGWAAFLFQSQHGVNNKLNPLNLLEYLIGQIGVFSPLFIGLIYYTAKKLFNKATPAKEHFLIWCFLPVFLFFGLTSLTYPAGANWPAIAYLPAIIFLAAQLHHSFQSGSSPLKTGLLLYIGISCLISLNLLLLIRYPSFFINTLHWKVSSTLSDNVFGWKELGKRIDRELAKTFPDQTGNIPLFSDESYQTASELQFYVAKPAAVFTTREARHSEFDYLTVAQIRRYDGRAGLLILENPLPSKAGEYFQGLEKRGVVKIRRFRKTIRQFQIYRFQTLNAAGLYEMAKNKPLGYPGRYRD